MRVSSSRRCCEPPAGALRSGWMADCSKGADQGAGGQTDGVRGLCGPEAHASGGPERKARQHALARRLLSAESHPARQARERRAFLSLSRGSQLFLASSSHLLALKREGLRSPARSPSFRSSLGLNVHDLLGPCHSQW
jgi:hypothetical protein